MSSPWLIVGLGNPGPRYAGTRHNVGQMVLDVVASRVGGSFSRHKAGGPGAQILPTRLGTLDGGVPGPRVVLAKPETFMNVSGPPVKALSAFFDIPHERVLVVHDELDLPPETLRLKRGGGEGGHNGLRSITQSLGSKEYVRLRVGIGRPPGRQDPAGFVLSDFAAVERPGLAVTVEEAADAVEDVVLEGLEKAQLHLHTS